MFQQLSGRNLRKGRNHLMWVLLQFISGSIQKNPVSNKFIHFIYKWWLLVSIHLIPKAITQKKNWHELKESEIIRAKCCFCTVLHIFHGEESKFESEGKWQLFCNVIG